MRYVFWKDRRELARDLKRVYGASTLEVAEREFEEFSAKWGGKYPHVVKSWKENWKGITTFFVFQVSGRDKACDVYYKHYRERKQQISQGYGGKESFSDGGIAAQMFIHGGYGA